MPCSMASRVLLASIVVSARLVIPFTSLNATPVAGEVPISPSGARVSFRYA